MANFEKIKFTKEVEIPNPVGAAYYTVEAEHAEKADKADKADKATKADRAAEADHAVEADIANKANGDLLTLLNYINKVCIPLYAEKFGPTNNSGTKGVFTYTAALYSSDTTSSSNSYRCQKIVALEDIAKITTLGDIIDWCNVDSYKITIIDSRLLNSTVSYDNEQRHFTFIAFGPQPNTKYNITIEFTVKGKELV